MLVGTNLMYTRTVQSRAGSGSSVLSMGTREKIDGEADAAAFDSVAML